MAVHESVHSDVDTEIFEKRQERRCYALLCMSNDGQGVRATFDELLKHGVTQLTNVVFSKEVLYAQCEDRFLRSFYDPEHPSSVRWLDQEDVKLEFYSIGIEENPRRRELTDYFDKHGDDDNFYEALSVEEQERYQYEHDEMTEQPEILLLSEEYTKIHDPSELNKENLRGRVIWTNPPKSMKNPRASAKETLIEWDKLANNGDGKLYATLFLLDHRFDRPDAELVAKQHALLTAIVTALMVKM